MEDDLKILKVEYLRNKWSDLPQILNFRLGDQTTIENCSKWRQPSMEDDLKILKVKYLSNHWLDLTQIMNISLSDLSEIENAWNEDDLQRKTTSKY